MFTLKFYKKIDEDQKKPLEYWSLPAPFDFDSLAPTGFLRLAMWLWRLALPAICWFFREVWPNARIGRLVFVARYEDVKQVVLDDQAFNVPFGREMTELAHGVTPLLGLDGPAHEPLRRRMDGVIKKGDLPFLANYCAHLANVLLDASGGRIDTIKDFVTRISAEASAAYYGLEIADPDSYADWALAASNLLFADPTGEDNARRLALYAGQRLRDKIARATAAARKRGSGSTVIDRLVAAGADDTEIRGTMMAFIVGFVPTITLAGGKILDELLDRPEAWAAAVAKAKALEKNPSEAAFSALQDVLVEVARLNPPLTPGMWRYAGKDAVIAPGTSRARKVPKDSVVLVASMAAVNDPRQFKNPGRFLPGRDPWPDLLFGCGIHTCSGTAIALTVITAMLGVLLARDGLCCAKKHGRLRWVDPYPRRLDMEFDARVPRNLQSMITILAPVVDGTSTEVLKREIGDRLGNPALGAIRAALDATGIIHFASLSAVDMGKPEKPSPRILFEINADGPEQTVLESIADKAGHMLEPIFRHADPQATLSLADLLARNVLTLRCKPWCGDGKATGVDVNGTRQFSVASIEHDFALAEFTKGALTRYQQGNLGLDGRAMQMLAYVRRQIRLHPRFCDSLIRPNRPKLKLAYWIDPSNWEGVIRVAQSPIGSRLRWGFVGMVLVLLIEFTLALGFQGWAQSAGRIILAATVALFAALVLPVLALLAVALLMRHADAKDVPCDETPSLAQMQPLVERENHPGYAQNHITVVVPMKPGWFRKVTLAAGLYFVKLVVAYFYRPGFVQNIGTIHYAKWFRPPGCDKFMFLSNFDGSWESYLEDFIMKANYGQTGVWSNGTGFPATRWLVLGGASDGDRFKRWVRCRQVPTDFWYVRFPKLTTDQIRNNALIHDGLAHANTDTAARAWLGCFGSQQRPDFDIETSEVQSLLFTGLRELQYSTFAVVKLDGNSRRAEWLRSLAGYSNGHFQQPLVSFGDHFFENDEKSSACFVAFSAKGLRALKLDTPDSRFGLGSFAAAFNMGMVGRAKLLGDVGESDPQAWLWADQTGLPCDGADAVLLVYGKSREQCAAALAQHAAILGDAALGPTVETAPSDKGIDFEHFGFRDGISQPVIQGTQRFAGNGKALSRDVVQPGEFIFGYRNNAGYFPPSPTICAETDSGDHLPILAAEAPPQFPRFETDAAASAIRDFGRNGTFLVVRQLVQDVKGFNNFTDGKASELNQRYRNLADVMGVQVNGNWVAAKLMGRRHDGTPLLDHVHRRDVSSTRHFGKPDNDFSFGMDDPRGVHCPLGAHIRRANPRDSLLPGDPQQQAIVNRHRILRRGRTYEASGDGRGVEKGLLFICLCADLERQFEFVQQSWIGSPYFHGLVNEPDPIAAQQANGTERSFSIPMPSGLLTLRDMQSFVTVRAGGYFFLPSRSAISYLAELQ